MFTFVYFLSAYLFYLADLVAVAVCVAAADGAARRPLAQLVRPAVRVHRAHRHAELPVTLEVNNSRD